MAEKEDKVSTRGHELRLSFSGTARFDLEDVVGDRKVTRAELDQLIEDATKRATDALCGAECHGIELDDVSFIFDVHDAS